MSDLPNKNGNFDTWIYFSGNFDQLTHGGNQIFKTNGHTSDGERIKVVWTVNGDGNLEYDLTNDLEDLVQLKQAFTLDTLADYNAFSDAIENINLTVHVTDGTVETVTP